MYDDFSAGLKRRPSKEVICLAFLLSSGLADKNSMHFGTPAFDPKTAKGSNVPRRTTAG